MSPPICSRCLSDAAFEILYSTTASFGVGYRYYCAEHARALTVELKPLANPEIDRFLITHVPRSQRTFGYADYLN